jgi:hypothetical protein
LEVPGGQKLHKMSERAANWPQPNSSALPSAMAGCEGWCPNLDFSVHLYVSVVKELEAKFINRHTAQRAATNGPERLCPCVGFADAALPFRTAAVVVLAMPSTVNRKTTKLAKGNGIAESSGEDYTEGQSHILEANTGGKAIVIKSLKKQDSQSLLHREHRGGTEKNSIYQTTQPTQSGAVSDLRFNVRVKSLTDPSITLISCFVKTWPREVNTLAFTS